MATELFALAAEICIYSEYLLMQQKFISHPDQSAAIDLTKVDIINRSHLNGKASLVFSKFGSADYVEWAFDTHEQARKVYEWVMSLLPLTAFDPNTDDPINIVSFVEQMQPAEPIAAIAPIEIPDIYEGPQLQNPSTDKTFSLHIDEDGLLRCVTLDGIHRDINYVSIRQVGERTAIAIANLLSRIAIGEQFTADWINKNLPLMSTTVNDSMIADLMRDLGCVKNGHYYSKTDVPF